MNSEMVRRIEDQSEEKSISRLQAPNNADHKTECRNCHEILAKLSECEICMSPLQGGVAACSRCGGFWCGGCSKRLNKCPYCRAPPPRQPCLAFARLLQDLNLPCRNQRWGCEVLLTSESRRRHESICPHRQVVCPMDDKCGCCLPMDSMRSHIEKSHSIPTFSVERVNVVIDQFGDKMMQTSMLSHKYKLCLLIHGAAFVLKVSFFNYRIVLTIVQRKIKFEVDTETTPKKFQALLEFHSEMLNTETLLKLSAKGYTRNTLMSKDQFFHVAQSKALFSDKVHMSVRINPMYEDPS